MRLLNAHVTNFKLLEDTRFTFSTDRAKPLTMIRAENGSGKTSLLYALAWGFFGHRGLPVEAQGLRLISSACPVGIPVTVQVTIEFENDSVWGTQERYRLIRTVTETPQDATDTVKPSGEKVRLVHLTDEGDEEADTAILEKLLPLHLKNVFFTNGEDVQTFIAGGGAADQQQRHVRDAIRWLLGLEALETTIEDIQSVNRKLRSEAARSAGADVAKAEIDSQASEDRKKSLEEARDDLLERRRNMHEDRARCEKELQTIQGLGDLDRLNAEIKEIATDIQSLNEVRAHAFSQFRAAIRSEKFSWSLGRSALEDGMAILQKLADSNVIPGVSIEVLRDRLSDSVCICGESLDPGDPAGAARRQHVEHIIDSQRRVSETSQRMTGIWHIARNSAAADLVDTEGKRTFWNDRERFVRDLKANRESATAKNARKARLTHDRSNIDDRRVRELSERMTQLETKISGTDRELGEIAEKIRVASEQVEASRRDRDQVRLTSGKHSVASFRRDVAEDLLQLATGALATLQNQYVVMVGQRTSEIFMEIVGSDPEFEASVFTGVRIEQDTFNIIVESQAGRRLDPSFELNGASQRALTLAFIWALAEVSETTAPRIIDTPLGMVSGKVKSRMVNAITAPAPLGSPDFQVVLLLTRSEIRDIEALLAERTGAVTTMSCSKDAGDLRFEWGVDRPLVRTCACDHRHSCTICARTYDDQHGITFIPSGETV